MENKEIKITPPEGYEIDKENSTFDCIKFKLIKSKLTYEDISNSLFNDVNYHYIDTFGTIQSKGGNNHKYDLNNCTSEKQAKKLLAINQLMNVAKYLNGDWKPDWSDGNEKYSIKIDYCDYILIDSTINFNDAIVYFKSKDVTKQAISILGEDTIRLVHSTDW